MSPKAPWLSKPVLPTQAEVALAIAILRSKPADVAIRDHVIHLRGHIQLGQSPYDREEQSHYFDLVGYWKNQYERLQEECDRLRSINIKLERSNQILSSQNNITPDNRPGTAPVVDKRRALASSSKPPRRGKAPTIKTSEQSVARTHEVIEDDFEFLEGLGSDGANLLEQLYTSHRLCRTTEPHPESICRSLVQTSSALTKLIRFISHNHESLTRQARYMPGPSTLKDDKSNFALALTVAARAFMSILVGITKMTSVDSDDRLPNLIICELVDMFKTSLWGIETCARFTAEKATTMPAVLKKTKGKSNTNIPKESPSARSLAHFLIGLLGLLDESNAIHHRLFDGFVFILLERVGQRLYYCTFKHHREANIENSFTLLSSPPAMGKAGKEREELGIRLEVKALILVLQRSMGLAPHHMSSAESKTPRSSNQLGRTLSLKTLPSAPRTRLSTIAKDRLQRTLITCMYGNKSDDEFLDVLTKPIPSMRVSSLLNVAKIEINDVDQWYKEEVWRLVGWDVLARDSGW